MNFINNKDKVGSSIILLFAIIYLNVAIDLPTNRLLDYEVFTARTLPVGLAIIAIFVCLLQMFIPASNAEDETISTAIAGFRWRPCLLLTGLMLLYGLTFNFLGFSLGTSLFLFTGFSIMGEKRYLVSVAVSGAVTAFMWIILTQVFDIFLDPGNLYRLTVGS